MFWAGKYAVEAIVGRGGMGVVLVARRLELDERVSIKLILAEDGVRGVVIWTPARHRSRS